MTVRAWLNERSPAPPVRLRARIDAALGERCDRDAAAAPELCLTAAEELLGELLGGAATGRASALDLLTVDALVTYAFESAATTPSRVSALAVDAMGRLATVAYA